MKASTASIALVLAALAVSPANANFGGGPKDEQKPSPPQGISSISQTPRQEAERLYADAREEIDKAEKDLADGKAKNAQKRFKKALDRGERAVGKDSKYYEAWNVVGYSARHLKDYDRAFAAYDKCLALKPDYAPAREYLGEAYLELGQLDKAREQLAWLQRNAASSEEAKDLAKEVAEYERAHGMAPADSARAPAAAAADTSARAPADTSGAGGGSK